MRFLRHVPAGSLVPHRAGQPAAFAGQTEAGQPLPPAVWRTELLADYYSWLRDQHYRNASISLYLVTARQNLDWLDAERELPAKQRIAEVKRLLEKKSGKRSRRILPYKREADDSRYALLAHPADGLAHLATSPRVKVQRRLILLSNRALIWTLYATADRTSEVGALTSVQVQKRRVSKLKGREEGDKERTVFLNAPGQHPVEVPRKTGPVPRIGNDLQAKRLS